MSPTSASRIDGSPNDNERLPLMMPTQKRSWQEMLDCMVWVVTWMFVSAFMIISCKLVFTTGGFPYPVTLTCMHMVSCFAVFGSIRLLAPRRLKLAIMPDAEQPMPWDVYCKNVLTISVFFSLTLAFGQFAYLYASVAFIQMMKPMNCIFCSLAAFSVGVEVPTPSHMIIVLIVAGGVFTASYNAGTEFSLAGTLLQIASSTTEGVRLAFVQLLTTSGVKVDPVSTVYYYSLPSAVLLACGSLVVEKVDFSKLISPWVLVVNCVTAVILNVLVATVIKKTSAVVFTLSGVVKDVGLVFVSTLIFLTPVTRLSIFGYSISVSGLCMYKAYKDNIEVFKEKGFLHGMRVVVESMNRKAIHS